MLKSGGFERTFWPRMGNEVTGKQDDEEGAGHEVIAMILVLQRHLGHKARRELCISSFYSNATVDS